VINEQIFLPLSKMKKCVNTVT